MKRVTISVQGRVQGVFFRAFIKELAVKLGLKGYVKNIDNDKVEIVAEGEYELLNHLAEIASKGPPLARVLKHDVNYEEASNEFADFKIKH